MFWTSPGPASGGITVFMWHLVFCHSVKLAVWCAGAYAPAHQIANYTDWQNTNYHINTFIPPDDGPGEVQNL
jgi:hypothetical protein